MARRTRKTVGNSRALGKQVDAKASKVHRGARYAATITDYRKNGWLIASLCEVDRLGHAWSGGAAGHP